MRGYKIIALEHEKGIASFCMNTKNKDVLLLLVFFKQ